MRILYFDCFSGISGDMSLAALVDAGADLQYIDSELKKIAIEPFALEWKRVNKSGISALHLHIQVNEHEHPHHHRHYSEIVELIQQAGFNERVTKLSLDIFHHIGIAESKIHNIPIEHVHFHEVGAIDSIVDIIGVALAIDSLQVEQIISAPVPLGSGTVKCDHGLYPVPAPATLEIMKGLPTASSIHSVELTTPTGAGIVAGAVNSFSTGLPPMIVSQIGYGAGTRDLPNSPNVLRVVIGEVEAVPTAHAHGHHHHDHHHHSHEHHSHDHSHEHHAHHHSHEHDETHHDPDESQGHGKPHHL